MTLIEIMIVVGLMALLTATLILGSGVLLGANRRAAATLVVAGVRKGIAHANTTGKPVRLVLDMENERVILEESGSSLMLRKSDEEEEMELEEAQDAGDRLFADAEALADSILSGAGSSGDRFSAIDALGQDGDSPGRDLGSGIHFVKVQTEHDEKPIEDGQAYILFWPGGLTERAVVQIAQKGDDEGLTVVVSPLTGRAVIERGLVDLPEEVFDAEEFSERDER
jgi:general secretion pathway protein H